MAEFSIHSSDIDNMKAFFKEQGSAFGAESDALIASINGLINLPDSEFSGETVRKLSI